MSTGMWFSIITIIILLSVGNALLKKPKGENTKESKLDLNNLPYTRINSLLTPTENKFFQELLAQVSSSKFLVMSKVRLLDLMDVPKNSDKRQSYIQRVWSKHVDFVICDRETMQPILVIELDDKSHNRNDRQQRDLFVDKALESAQLRVTHVKVGNTYNFEEIRRFLY